MKNYLLFILLCIVKQSAIAQTITVTGTIKDIKGNPVSSVFVQENKSTYASGTYTDSLGFFSLPIDKYSKLIIKSQGFNDTLVNVGDNKNLEIVISSAKAKMSNNFPSSEATNIIKKDMLQDAFSARNGIRNTNIYSGLSKNSTGTLFPVFSSKEETRGSRYLFNKWSKGFVLDTNNQIIRNSAYLFNYDKIAAQLLLTQDQQSAIEVDKSLVKSFVLQQDDTDSLVYEHVPSIDKDLFVQVIYLGNKFKIYKLTRTKFVKSNYHTDGIATIGNPYDEYIDENSYYILDAGNQMRKLSLKRKSIKEVFASDKEKVEKFFSENNNETINDDFLKRLGNYLNN